MKDNFYIKLWKKKRVIFNPATTSSFRKLLFRLSNLFRVPPVCLNCGKEMGYWRDGNPICYRCDLV